MVYRYGIHTGVNTPQKVVWYITVVISIFYIALTIKSSIQHNRNILIGIVIGIFKISAALLGAIVIFEQMGKAKE